MESVSVHRYLSPRVKVLGVPPLGVGPGHHPQVRRRGVGRGRGRHRQRQPAVRMPRAGGVIGRGDAVDGIADVDAFRVVPEETDWELRAAVGIAVTQDFTYRRRIRIGPSRAPGVWRRKRDASFAHGFPR